MYVNIMKKKDSIVQNLHHKLIDLKILFREYFFHEKYCRWCKEEIDPNLCWCGDAIEDHTSWCEHTPIPMGCRCGFVSLSDKFNID